MKKPTLEEVKEYFKDALEVRCLNDRSQIFKYDESLIGLTDITKSFYTGEYDSGYNCKWACIWSERNGYTEITKYKDYTKRDSKGLKNPNAKHYELWNDFEAIDVIKASLTPEEYKGYLKGNILKYKLRDKGQDESDKVKIKDYQNELNNN